MRPLSLLLLFSTLGLVASSLSNFPIVSTGYGSVRGYEYTAKNGGVGEIFKKIPFAAPPVGELRWRRPRPPEPWNHTLDGTFFGPACAQRSSFWDGWVTGFSEDCLHLNVYSSRACRESNATCPVVLYIHGGLALFDGTMMFPDEALVANFVTQGVIMVTIEYRLGVFGVMALGDEHVLPANLALHDCLEALRFLHREIHHFGGDKSQITVMGHSTGATMALLFAVSPGINKQGGAALFSRVISMSGTMNLESEEKQVQRSHGVAANLGCAGSAQEIVDCLRPLSTEQILSSSFKVGGEDVFSAGQVNNLVQAGELIPIRSVRELRTNLKGTKLLLGTVLYEFEVSFRMPEAESDKVNVILGVENVDECYAKYVSDRQSGAFEPGYITESQGIFVTNWLYAKAEAEAGSEVYLYQYDYPEHALHTDDIYYIMGFHEHPTDINEKWLSRVYPLYFTNFIKGLPLAPDWKPLDPRVMNYYSVNKSFTDDVSPEMRTGYQKTLTDYYEEMLKFDENLSRIKRKVLNSSVQYKSTLLSSDSFNLRDLLFYGTCIGVIVFAFYSLHRYCIRGTRSQNSERDQLLSNNSYREFE